MSVAPVLHIATFGYDCETPPMANLVLDVRWMPNPLATAALHDLSGLDHPVQDWLLAQPDIADWLAALIDTLDPQVTDAEKQDSRAVTWTFGCADGRGQSVVVAEYTAATFRRTGMTVLVNHPNIPQSHSDRGSPAYSS